MEDEKPDEETADNIRMSKLGENPKTPLGAPPISLRQKEESPEFMRGYRAGYTDRESRKSRRF
jgi:hypothetical protein